MSKQHLMQFSVEGSFVPLRFLFHYHVDFEACGAQVLWPHALADATVVSCGPSVCLKRQLIAITG